MRKICYLVICLLPSLIIAQPNCEAYKYAGDELKYKACIVSEKRAGHYQFSREYQEALDESLAIDSTFAYAYKAKSTAYLKSGDFIEWKRLMDLAVKYDPISHLSYRGWCRYQFFKDYRGAIQDIEQLDSLIDYDIGHSVNGDYHLHIARALCYKALGQKEKAIEIIENQLNDSSHFLTLYDHFHLGVLYLETGQIERAIAAFRKQIEINDIADNHYYLALAYLNKEEKELSNTHLELAKSKYLEGYKIGDPYSENMDKVYLSEIEEQIQLLKAN